MPLLQLLLSVAAAAISVDDCHNRLRLCWHWRAYYYSIIAGCSLVVEAPFSKNIGNV